jgi:hypothetical protein
MRLPVYFRGSKCVLLRHGRVRPFIQYLSRLNREQLMGTRELREMLRAAYLHSVLMCCAKRTNIFFPLSISDREQCTSPCPHSQQGPSSLPRFAATNSLRPFELECTSQLALLPTQFQYFLPHPSHFSINRFHLQYLRRYA